MLKERGIIDEISMIQDIVNIQLTNNSLVCLLELLDFAERAANVLIDLELKDGNIPAAQKMKSYGNNAITLSDVIYKHLDIGEPINRDTRN